VPVEAGEDAVGAALHVGAPLHPERLVPRDRVDGGLEPPDVLAHLEQQLPLRDPDHAGLVTAHAAR
jgi:hypothetical protein